MTRVTSRRDDTNQNDEITKQYIKKSNTFKNHYTCTVLDILLVDYIHLYTLNETCQYLPYRTAQLNPTNVQLNCRSNGFFLSARQCVPWHIKYK